ncbi:hypothetical protein COY28_04935 [Candidatus Woesearchaeota archaeon CG_4_10_14_0_2_um_filter_57_5]|nr:MAG: hypothetical protein AUJ68_02795 [Candidatus Woesearchaeota archaeon CG1_02_57_44]PIN69463.1 MAG: hypothetical protein COV94_02840 [Candidatus Woesearchaeota archaeon CG11_big_fil_rev_8_21_14_0_20_57_5]PIZ51612.1 MAG: hypothetical protein COY28_04935 [Candidatus Woesearchaeota archaeon CG_4_10_14_0_2_um_filter_57_5]
MRLTKKELPGKRLLVTAIDAALAGRSFEEDDKVLDFSAGFFAGADATPDEIIAAVKLAHHAIVAGEKTIALVEEKIGLSSVKKIDGIPYAILVEA